MWRWRFQSTFRNPQSPIEWLSSPGSQKLGAKWVEVTVECEADKISQERI
jgi:hypothetical protein